jgi:hypothetical protein
LLENTDTKWTAKINFEFISNFPHT